MGKRTYPSSNSNQRGVNNVTGNVTLVSSSPAYQRLTPTGYGYRVILPAGTSCPNNQTPFTLKNDSSYDVTVDLNSNTHLGWIRAGQTAIITLIDNSTSDGVWIGDKLEKIGVTAYNQMTGLSVVGDGSNAFTNVTLDSTRTLFVFGSSTLYAVVYDSSSLTWGTPLQITTSGSSTFTAILSSSNVVLLLYNNGSSVTQGVTLSVSGTAVTKNTIVSSGNTNSALTKLIQVGTAFVLLSVISSVPSLTAISISGTTPSFGTPVSSTGAGNIIYAASSTVVITFYISSSTIVCKPYTISGTTLTAGTSNAASYGSTPTGTFKTILLGTGRWLTISALSDGTAQGSLFSISGSVASSSNVLINSNLGVGGIVTASRMSDANLFGSISTISSNKVCVFWCDNTNLSVASNIVIDTSGTPSVGNVAVITHITGAAQPNNNTTALNINGNIARFTTNDTNNLSMQYSIDCTAASPVMSIVSGVKSNNCATPLTSDAYNNKNGTLLLAGNNAYTYGGPTNNSSAIDSVIYYLSNNQTINKPTAIYAGNSTNTVSSGSNSAEIWSNQTFNDTIYALIRIEAAA